MRVHRYEAELAEKYRFSGVKVHVDTVLPHPVGELVVAESRILGADGYDYDSCALHLHAPGAPEPWTYGVPFPRELAGPLGAALLKISQRGWGG